MSDRPDYDPEKNFETTRAQWTKESHLSLPSKLEGRLTLIEEQLSALFQLATKALGDTIDARIESDSKNSKLEEMFIAIRNLEKRVQLLKTELDAEAIDLTKLHGAVLKNDSEIWEELDGVLAHDIERLFEEIRKLKTK